MQLFIKRGVRLVNILLINLFFNLEIMDLNDLTIGQAIEFSTKKMVLAITSEVNHWIKQGTEDSYTNIASIKSDTIIPFIKTLKTQRYSFIKIA